MFLIIPFSTGRETSHCKAVIYWKQTHSANLSSYSNAGKSVLLIQWTL